MDFFNSVKSFFGIEEGPHFSKAEIARHHNRDSLWIVADGTVYDITQFIDQHAGGVQSLLKRGGGVQDCAKDFGFHSNKAQTLWKSFKIGYVAKDGKTDDEGRNFLRSRGMVPVEDLPKGERTIRCAGSGRQCTFHFEEKQQPHESTILPAITAKDKDKPTTTASSNEGGTITSLVTGGAISKNGGKTS